MGSLFPAGRRSVRLFILALPSLHPHGSKWQYYSLVLFETETIICLGITRRHYITQRKGGELPSGSRCYRFSPIQTFRH